MLGDLREESWRSLMYGPGGGEKLTSTCQFQLRGFLAVDTKKIIWFPSCYLQEARVDNF